MQKITMLLILFFFIACEEQEALPTNPANSQPTKGFDAYIFACETDGELIEVCKCQAEILQKNLSDEEIFILAEAGVAASNGEFERIDYIMENHPKILIAMDNLSLDAEICSAAATIEIELLE